MGSNAARSIKPQYVPPPEVYAEPPDPNEWWENECAEGGPGWARLPKSVLAKLKNREFMTEGQRLLVLEIIDQTHGEPLRSERGSTRKARPKFTGWVSKQTVAEWCGLKGAECRQVETIIADGDQQQVRKATPGAHRGIFLCERKRGLYRFQLTPWLWAQAPNYQPNRVERKPPGTATAPKGEEEPAAKAPREIAPQVYEPGKRSEPLPFPVVSKAIVFDVSAAELPVEAGATYSRGRIVVSISCRAPDGRRKGETTQSTAFSSRQVAENNKGARANSGAVTGGLIEEQPPGSFDLCYARWQNFGRDRKVAVKLFTELWKGADDALIDAFKAGFEAWVDYHETNGWQYAKQTFAQFLDNEQWRYPPPRLKPNERDESLKRMEEFAALRKPR